MMYRYFFKSFLIFLSLFLFTGNFEVSVRGEDTPMIPMSGPKNEKEPSEMIEIGGVVLDKQGQPIAQAKVSCWIAKQSTTDQQGQWTTRIPKETESLELIFWPPGNEHRKTRVKKSNLDSLKEKKLKTKLKDAYVLEGCVHDPEGQPLSGVLVYAQNEFSLPCFFLYEESIKTDEKGDFRFKSSESGDVDLGFFSKQFAPKVASAKFDDAQKPVDVDLESGKRMKIQVVDEKGNPQKSPSFSLYMKGALFFFGSFGPEVEPMFTPVEPGTWELNVPKSTPMELNCRIDSVAKGKEKFMSSSCTSQELLAHTGDSPFRIIMYKTLKLSGKVYDADSGETIKDYLIYAYEKVPASTSKSGKEEIRWSSEYSHKKEKDDNGTYSCTFSDVQKNYYLKAEAKGYQLAISKAFHASQGKVEYDFKLSKTGPIDDEAVRVGEPYEQIKRWDVDRDLVDY